MITLKRFLTQQVDFTRSSHFATLPLSHAVAHPLPLPGEGMNMAVRCFNPRPLTAGDMDIAVRGFNPLARLRERVGERGGLSIATRLNHAK